MKYRIQLTVDGAILGQLIDLAFKNAKHDPEPKILSQYPDPPPPPPPPLAPDVESALFPPAKTHATTKANGERIVDGMLKTGPKRWSELRDGLVAEGFRKEAINRIVTRWESDGKIRRTDEGLWALAEDSA